MTYFNKVVWSEGLFLKPHHFQQQERYFDRMLSTQAFGLGPFHWGVEELKIDSRALEGGLISVSRFKGTLPDGTSLSFPDYDLSPDPLSVEDIKSDYVNAELFLVLPSKEDAALEICSTSDSEEEKSGKRFMGLSNEVQNVVDRGRSKETFLIAKLKPALVVGKREMLKNVTYLPIGKIKDIKNSLIIALDTDYIPPTYNCDAIDKLRDYLAVLSNIVRNESEKTRTEIQKFGNNVNFRDLSKLQILNRYEPLLTHLSKTKFVHPIKLFEEVLQLVGELSTFLDADRKPPNIDYDHENLAGCFGALLSCLQSYMHQDSYTKAYELDVSRISGSGIYKATIAERNVIRRSQFYIAIREDQITSDLIDHTFICGSDIERVFNNDQPGIEIKRMSHVEHIPAQPGYAFFSISRHSDHWAIIEGDTTLTVYFCDPDAYVDFKLWVVRD